MKQVHVELDWRIDEFHVYVFWDDGNVRHHEEPGGVIRTFQEGELMVQLQPTFSVPRMLVPNLIEAFQKAGVQPKQLTLIEGKYEAQSAHLKDLQLLLQAFSRKVLGPE